MQHEPDVSALRIIDLEASAGSCPDGWVHRKCIPYAIIVQPTEGSYTVTSTTASVTIATGEVALVAAQEPVAFAHHAGAQGRMRSRWLHVKALYREAIDPCALSCTPSRIARPAATRIGGLLAVLTTITPSPPADGPGAQATRLGLAYQILGLALSAATAHPRREALLTATAQLGPLTAWLQARLHLPLTIADVAGAAGLSRSRLHAVVQEHLGCSPMAHLKELRLAAAARELLTSTATIADIADRSGFANPFHFSREFTRRYGMPPRLYRSQQRLSLGSDERRQSRREIPATR